ncbi:MAG TPA: hypothetical protein VGG06_31310 [Thermoanaerobaculia bacterium]
MFDLTDYQLTEDALGIVADWLTWHLHGGIPEGSFLADTRRAPLAEES